MDDLLLDACVAINLVASGVDLNELAEASSVRLVLTSVAAAETLWLTPLTPGGDRENINVEDLVRRGSLAVVELRDDELEQFIFFATEVDDGEAATFAVAAKRGLRVATDDRRAQRLAAAADPQIATIGTTQLLKTWVDTKGIARERIVQVVHSVELRASYIPRRDDPHLAWWVAHRYYSQPG